MVNIAWGITGAYDKLEASFEQVEKIAATEKVRITTFISQAGAELVLHLGLKDRLAAISNGDPYREICTPKTHGASVYLACRFFAREYDVFIIAPCSSNTLCKLYSGIADTPVTTAACWALKGSCPVFVLQTHLSIGKFDSPVFVRLKEGACRRCDVCPPVQACAPLAITRKKKLPLINLLKCRCCGDCVPACPYGAVAPRESLRLQKRMVDQVAAEKLGETKGVAVLTDPRQISQTLHRYAVQLPGLRLDDLVPAEGPNSNGGEE